MYNGFLGPIPILHWFIASDVESSYDLTEIEMLIHILASTSIAYSLFRGLKTERGYLAHSVTHT